MLLATYRARTTRLLQNPAAPSSLYASADIDSWINQARNQVAGQGECVRYLATLDTVTSQRPYDFTDLDTGDPDENGIDGVIHVRSIMYAVGGGYKFVPPRPWQWFQLYGLSNAAPVPASPGMWSQYAQGVNGSFYLDPPPDTIYTLTCDCVCFPIDLTGDPDEIDAIPNFWTDAVPYYAAYLALLSAQSPARSNDANAMFERFEEFMKRARTFANPRITGYAYEQSIDPVQGNKLAVSLARGGGGQGGG